MPVRLGPRHAAQRTCRRMKTVALEVENAKHAFGRRRFIADLFELVKARLTALVLLTTAVGFYLGSEPSVDYAALFRVVFGTAAAAAGAAALNQWWERKADALMNRTRTRPVPAGRMRPSEALTFGLVLSIFGVGVSCAGLQPAERGTRCDNDHNLHLRLYATEASQHRKHGCWCDPGRDPASDWLGGGSGSDRRRCGKPFRNSFAVAIASFLRDCLDVSRRLFASGFSHDFKR